MSRSGHTRRSGPGRLGGRQGDTSEPQAPISAAGSLSQCTGLDVPPQISGPNPWNCDVACGAGRALQKQLHCGSQDEMALGSHVGRSPASLQENAEGHQTHRGEATGLWGRAWSGPAASQGTLAATRSCQRQGMGASGGSTAPPMPELCPVAVTLAAGEDTSAIISQFEVICCSSPRDSHGWPAAPLEESPQSRPLLRAWLGNPRVHPCPHVGRAPAAPTPGTARAAFLEQGWPGGKQGQHPLSLLTTARAFSRVSGTGGPGSTQALTEGQDARGDSLQPQ